MIPSAAPPNRNGVSSSTSAASAPDHTMSTDAYFLSWGSSVNVSEDLRRSIRAEIEEIDGSIRELEANIKAEERTLSLLSKDQTHAHLEMKGLRRSMGDAFDAASMNEQVRKRMGETQKTQVLALFDITGSTLTSSLSSRTNENFVNLEDGTGNGEDPTKSIAKYEIYLSEKVAEKKKLQDMISKVTDELNQMKALALSYEEEAQIISNRIETEKLEERLHDAQNKEDAQRKEKEAESQRKRSIKEAVQYARAKCGEYAQQIADKTKELTAAKKKHATEEAELAKRVAAAEEELRSLPSNSHLEAQVSFLEDDIQRLNGQITEFESIRKAHNEVKLKREKVKKEIETSEKELLLSEEKVANAEYKCEEADGALKEAQDLALTLKAKKEANDKMETNEIHPGQIEQAELTKEKESLAEIINELGQKSQVITKKSDSALDEATKELDTIEEEEKRVRKEIEEVESSLNNFQNLCEKSKTATQAEVSELEKLTANLEQAIAAEVSQMETVKQQKEKEKKEKEEEQKKKNEEIKEALEEEHQICLLAIELVEKATKTVKELNGPIQLEDEEKILNSPKKPRKQRKT